MDQTTLNTLNEIVSLVIRAAEADSLEQALERIAHISRDLVKARYAALSVPDPEGGLRYFKVAGITPEQYQQIDHRPEGRGLLGLIVEERQTLRLENMSDHPRSVGFCANHPQMTSLLGVPIQSGQQFFGTLYLCDRLDGQPFSLEDQLLIEAVAGYAALAIVGIRFKEQQNLIKLMEERERIGMDLHDGVIQRLYATGMRLEIIRTSGSPDPEDLRPVVRDLNTIIEDIRDYIHDLRQRNYQASMYDSIATLVARLHVPDDLDVTINASDRPPPFPLTTFDGLLQIANEAVSNVIRHANATKLTITAQQKGNFFEFAIADDGRGFDLEYLQNQNGLGLRNIQERARLYDGEVQIDSTPDLGTRLVIMLPIPSV